MHTLLASLLILCAAPPTPPLGPDERFRTDVLFVGGHPDDEVLIGSLLSRLTADLHKSVSCVYCTRGGQGGNEVGSEHGEALRDVREIEGRTALSYWGVTHAWFLDAPDTPGQDVLRSLESWNHGAMVERVTRLMRLTRPRVVLTFLPAMTVGECHGDHQAAGVVATEAFDLAGDPAAFPAQLTPAREPLHSGNFGEGLLAWQPQKLYYFTDADSNQALDGKGPAYRATEISPSTKLTYQRMAALEASRHDSQDVGVLAKKFLAEDKYPLLYDPERLVFARAAVPATTTGDIFENTKPEAVPFAPPARAPQPAVTSGAWLELGGQWGFYAAFRRAHALTHLDDVPPPQASTNKDGALRVPLVLHNEGDQMLEVTLGATLPAGWTAPDGPATYRIPPHGAWPLEARVLAKGKAGERGKAVWTLAAGGKTVSEVSITACLSDNNLPQ